MRLRSLWSGPSWHWTVVISLILLALLGVVQIYHQIQMTVHLNQQQNGLSAGDPLTQISGQLQAGSGSSSRLLRQAYRRGNLDLTQVYGMTSDLRRRVHKQNQKELDQLSQLIRFESAWTILLIQVKSDSGIVRQLIDNLPNLAPLGPTVLVFALENYNAETEQIIQSASLPARSVLLVNPYCGALHPLWYPGNAPRRKCPPEKQQNISQLNCNNGRKFEHVTEKLTWAWSTSSIFEVVNGVQDFTGFVVHFDDGDTLSPDVFHFLRHLHLMRQKMCPVCAISVMSPWSSVQLGNMSKWSINIEDEIAYNSVHLTQLRGGFLHGVSLSPELWASLKMCAAQFCYQEDSSWRWSLQNILTKTCGQGKGFMLVPRATRLIPRDIRDSLILQHCSNVADSSNMTVRNSDVTVPSKNEESIPISRINTSQSLHDSTGVKCHYDFNAKKHIFFRQEFLFPRQLHAQNLVTELVTSLQHNADRTGQSDLRENGWHDVRDKQLCHAFFLGLQVDLSALDPSLTFV